MVEEEGRGEEGHGGVGGEEEAEGEKGGGGEALEGRAVRKVGQQKCLHEEERVDVQMLYYYHDDGCFLIVFLDHLNSN